MAQIGFKKDQEQKTAPVVFTTTIASQIVQKSVTNTRKDIQDWRRAETMALNVESRALWPLQILFKNVLKDTTLTSQVENRRLKVLSAPFILQDSSGNEIEDLTRANQNAKWVNQINNAIFERKLFAHSLIEVKAENGRVTVNLIPRENVDQFKGLVYLDYTNPLNYINYRTTNEYNKTLFEFGDLTDDLGLLNKAVPHVLMKRFTQSCWSELAEIYGIPPRVMKTNTHDPGMRAKGEQMLRDMGAAAWMLIDTTEDFQFAQGVQTNGDVYKNLLDFCNSELRLLITGVQLGQDSKNGSRSKEEVALDMFHDLINADLSEIEEEWNNKLMPALIEMGVFPKGTRYVYPPVEDIEELFKRTQQALQHYEVDAKWYKQKFGVEVTERKQPTNVLQQGLNISDSFFV